ncbi:hypothetical protein [Streptomyces sp. NPDC005799]|uniref:hypothetical protein n=1 Tax=Streptomyces sp. NPDC005799 TaxID=3154678 RepID=UPI0033EC9217
MSSDARAHGSPPVPDRGRALRQVLRHHSNQLPSPMREMRDRQQTALAALPHPGEYRISTR